MKGAASVLVQFALGLTFGLGLVIAGMSDPAKVLSFLDVAAIPTGGWDPSLAFVMIGAIGVTFVGFKLALRRAKPVLGDAFHLPTATSIDSRIVVGPAIFGVGWGLAGLCPGPAFTALAGGGNAALIFFIAMFCGMGSARWVANSSARSERAIKRS
jgi:hypothetical protein